MGCGSYSLRSVQGRTIPMNPEKAWRLHGNVTLVGHSEIKKSVELGVPPDYVSPFCSVISSLNTLVSHPSFKTNSSVRLPTPPSLAWPSPL